MSRYLLLTIVLLAASPLGATVLVPAEFREIVAGSQVIAYGRVVDVRAETVDGRRRIESVVRVEVSAYLKGGPGDILTLRVEGGQVGRYKSVTVGAPELRPGDEAIFFLTARGPAMARIFGLSQGLFRVRVDAAGRRVVVPPALMAGGDAMEAVRRGAADRKSVPLDAFAVQVRTAMAQPGGAR